MLNYQHIITASIGDFGRSQFIIVFACVMTKFFSAWCMLMMGFAGAKPNWWTQTISYNATTNTSTTIKHIKECPTFDNQTIYFDDDIFTIVSEWNLVCGRDWIPTLITTTQMIGVLVGAAVIGQLGDWIGRKKSLVFVAAMELVCVLLLGLSVNWHMMTAAAFFLGFSLGGYLVVISVYMLEYIGTKWRTPIGLIPSWALGVTVLGGMFKLLPNWRHLCYATAALGSPFVLLLSFSPESIRWLFIKGKNEKAKSILKKLAARNKRPDPDFKEIDKVLEEKTKTNENSLIQYNYLTVLLKDATRKKALLFAFMWFSCSFTYYGLTLGFWEEVYNLTAIYVYGFYIVWNHFGLFSILFKFRKDNECACSHLKILFIGGLGIPHHIYNRIISYSCEKRCIWFCFCGSTCRWNPCPSK
ncbi:solute carrier family 22 member 7-like isoform X4 [Hydractinia symbiolongicarpus]|uniref:solute carrier family 22 member 7-like isoform X4 n=1 Tax=Hydractinia symbiolongicarpus TaxID=13093 RepID=UPI002549D6BE|nr:solute carrier family 22 member 7-like isoform X4 [Hydractinia symbiolongicarpus]